MRSRGSFGRALLARAFRLRDIIGSAERQRLQADLGVPPRQRGRHDDDEIAFFASSCATPHAIKVRHLISSTATSGAMRST